MANTEENELVEKSVIGKLSVKTVGCVPNAVLAPDVKGPVKLLVVGGIANGIKVGLDARTGNPWSALLGSFEVINIQKGTESYGKAFNSGKLFLPAGIHDIVEAAVRKVTEDGKTGSVEFIFEVQSVKAGNPIGYSYEAISRMKPKESDPLEVIRANMQAILAGGSQKQLEAPKATPAKK